MTLFTLSDLESAAALVRRTVPPTPQYAWPLLSKRMGCEVWVKHENHTPTGAFKVRGGLVFMDGLKSSGETISGVISATRGNHGQSIALAGAQAGIPITIVVPIGNSVEKNAAMRAFGAELIEFGRDFDEAKSEASRLAQLRGLRLVPSFDERLVQGVATYGHELFRAVRDLKTVYVPVGMGSGICAMITVRDLLGLKTEIVGVVAEKAPAVALSIAAGKPVTTETALTFADGMACRQPDQAALDVISGGAARLIQVSEDAIAAAMRDLYTDTHNLAEGAGAAALAALGVEREAMAGRKVAVVLTGGNIDTPAFAEVLSGLTPTVPG